MAEPLSRVVSNTNRGVILAIRQGQASDETIQDLAGHVSKRMLNHYSHIRMEAKRRAVDSLVKRPEDTERPHVSSEAAKDSAKVVVVN